MSNNKQSMKTWLILPLFAFGKNTDGTKELTFGWLTVTFNIKW